MKLSRLSVDLAGAAFSCVPISILGRLLDGLRHKALRQRGKLAFISLHRSGSACQARRSCPLHRRATAGPDGSRTPSGYRHIARRTSSHPAFIEKAPNPGGGVWGFFAELPRGSSGSHPDNSRFVRRFLFRAPLVLVPTSAAPLRLTTYVVCRYPRRGPPWSL